MRHRKHRFKAASPAVTELPLLLRGTAHDKHEGVPARPKNLNPLWVITIGMGAFFVMVAAIMAVS